MAGRLIAVVGPTASGKSALAMELARAHRAEIVSCDSLQVYRRLDIGSAKPTREERAEIPHHLIDLVEPDGSFSAADYARLGRAVLEDLGRRGVTPIVVGGTGLYLRALVQGLFAGPSRDEGLRARLAAIAERGGGARLHRLLGRIDPAAAARIEPRDQIRVVRAIEVWRNARRPISEMQPLVEPLVGWDVHTIGLAPDRALLRERVERRTDEMISRGLFDEVRGLLASGLSPDLRPLQAIGYREAVAVVRGALDPGSARRDIVTATMRYAKRQMTWFRHQARVSWHSDASAAHAAASAWMAGSR